MRTKAILPEFSAFVSASAGTGKTKILIDRLLNLLLANNKPGKILCLAFTKAAAAEILSRINQKLAEFATCTKEHLETELYSLGFKELSEEIKYKARILFIELLDEAEPLNIQTIHSFCQQLLLKFPFESELGLNFSLLNENKTSLLITEAKDIFLNNISLYEKAEEAVSYLSWHIKEYSFNELLEEIIANRESLDNFFSLHLSLEKAINSIYPERIDEEQVIKEFIDNISINHEDLEKLYIGGKTDISIAEKITKFISLSEKSKIMLLNDYLGCFLTLTGDPTKSVLGKKIITTYPEVANIFENEQARAYKFNKFIKNTKALNLTNYFIIISYHIRKIYEQLKKQANAVDYDDLINLTLRLINNSEHAQWINYRLNGGIEHILIDEAQDNSSKQWEIINKISENFFDNEENQKSIFIVGDSKQSIFSFQGAKPELFNQMNKSLSDKVVRVQLNTSYRSGKTILELVDKIFNQDHLLHLVTDIEPIIEHRAHKSSNAKVELWPLIIEDEKEEIKEWVLPSDFKKNKYITASEKLANNIAERIRQDLDNKVISTAGDVLVLTRRRGTFINHLISALRKLNIPSSGIDRLKLLEHPIILDIISLTNFLLCSNDDLNLAITLKSPIFSITEDELLKLCYNRESSLWNELKKSSSHIKIVELIENLQKLSKNKHPFEFYFYIFESLSFRQYFKGKNYLETDDIIDSFLDLVKEYQNDNIPSLQLCLNFINNTKTEIKRDLSQTKDQVRIMTIHNSKGLQAKTIFLTDTTSLPSNKDSIIWLNKHQLLWPGKEKYYPDIAKTAKKEKQQQEYSEYIRLLYVALTRAEDNIIICGTAKNQNISNECWYKIIEKAIYL